VPHRIVASVSYRIEYINHLASTFSMFYSGNHQGRMSFTYSNDLNGDRNTSDLMYIPKDENGIQFTDILSDEGELIATAEAQRETFWNFVQNDDYLSDHKGEHAERFGKLEPWLNRFDFKFTQELFTELGDSRRGTVQLTLDILNAGNLINKNWGTYQDFGITNGYDNIQLLTVAGFQNGQPVYQLNAADVATFKENARFVDDVSTSSTWGMLLGIKVMF
jgi:hypothetical protein